ncbi:hypothetical protein P0M11_10440 [Kaistella sp. PBT33-4]|uniref:hypothetical protein n=1 Tax=Kaistella sp. PBT33-4 TaxID=3032000 RepID=UPI0023D8C7EF|nr:hypothetical protein [Kaistella sp. PBT33-4]MDF0720414.1 hypothetical protein [Kaistella sp. PBT33-4]
MEYINNLRERWERKSFLFWGGGFAAAPKKKDWSGRSDSGSGAFAAAARVAPKKITQS